jgi:hypothetical protein
LAASGADYHDGWLGRLAPDGTERWTIRLGNNLANAVAALPGDRSALVGFDGTEVYTWIVDRAGTIVTATRTRDSTGQRYTGFGKVVVAATTDAIYVASQWADVFHRQPVAVAKLQLDGKLLWRRVCSSVGVTGDKMHFPGQSARTITVCYGRLSGWRPTECYSDLLTNQLFFISLATGDKIVVSSSVTVTGDKRGLSSLFDSAGIVSAPSLSVYRYKRNVSPRRRCPRIIEPVAGF